MGLLDKLIKEGAEVLKEGAEVLKDVASEENKQKAAEIFGSIKDSISEHSQELKETLEQYKTTARSESENFEYDDSMFEDYEDGMTARERILKILSEEFPAYTVKENVSPAEFGGTGKFMNYSIVVYDGVKPKLLMMLIGKTTTSHREYRFSKEFAQSKGYTFINFVEHYPNRPDYISKRLHKYL